MKDIYDAPTLRDDLLSIARSAAESVPVVLSARRLRVRLLAALVPPLCIAAPFLGVTHVVAAAVVALAILVRLAALAGVLRGDRPRQSPVPLRLPRLTILLPLREEAAVVEGLVSAVRRLDYPADLVEVFALVEEDDPTTLAALRRHAPASWRIVVVPPGTPQTKPRACNVGLTLARGDMIVVFDGEDRPDPDQARKAAAGLAADARLAVVQARLGCDHAGPGAHLLVRFWALEYAVLFGAIQPALAAAGLPFLLGGTSNWFRTATLREIGGWDAHNVTEDADLGVRLARAGWRSAVIDSTTWEEAPIRAGQWTRQRSRWLAGFAITTAVHFSRPVRCASGLGAAGTLAILAQLPATLLCAAAHPLGLWLIVTGGPSSPLWLFAIGGYAVSVALHYAVARREGMAGWLAPAMLAYWLLQTGALALAAMDLVRAPARWRKTAHGLVERGAAPDVAAARPLIQTMAWTQTPTAANDALGSAAARRE